LLESVLLAEEFDQFGMLSGDLVDQAFFFLEEIFEAGTVALLFENLGDLTLRDTEGVALCEHIIQHSLYYIFE
jgi:hypothetical protein